MNKRIFFNLLFLLSLFWLVLWIWSISFHTRPWLNGFGSMVFVLTGLFLGIVYFFSFYEWYKRIGNERRTSKKRLAYVALVLVILFVTSWMIRAVLGIGRVMGNEGGIAYWLLVGFVLGGFILYTKDRLLRWVEKFMV